MFKFDNTNEKSVPNLYPYTFCKPLSLTLSFTLIRIPFLIRPSPAFRRLKYCLTDDVLRDIQDKQASFIDALEAEYAQLIEDRAALRQVFPTGESGVVLPCNLKRLIWNAQKIFRINRRQPTDLHPLKVIEGFHSVNFSIYFLILSTL